MNNLKKNKNMHIVSEVCEENLKREYSKDYRSSEVVNVEAVTSSWREIKIILLKKHNIFFHVYFNKLKGIYWAKKVLFTITFTIVTKL